MKRIFFVLTFFLLTYFVKAQTYPAGASLFVRYTDTAGVVPFMGNATVAFLFKNSDSTLYYYTNALPYWRAYQRGGAFYDSTLMSSVKRLKDSLTAVRNKEVADSIVLRAAIAAGGTNIYNSDGTLTATRTVSMSNHDLTFTGSGTLWGIMTNGSQTSSSQVQPYEANISSNSNGLATSTVSANVDNDTVSTASMYAANATHYSYLVLRPDSTTLITPNLYLRGISTGAGYVLTDVAGNGKLTLQAPAGGGSGTVTSIATTSPITGGTITNTGTIALDTTTAAHGWHSRDYNDLRYAPISVTGVETDPLSIHLTGTSTLTGNATVAGGTTNALLLTGNYSSGTQSGVLQVDNSNSGGRAIYGNNSSSSSGTGVYGNSAGTSGTGVVGNGTGNGVNGATTTGNGVYGQATTGNGVRGDATTGIAGNFNINSSTTNSAVTILKLLTNSTGTAANGLGGSIDYYIQTDNGTNRLANRFISKLTDVTDATRTSQIDLTGLNSAATETFANFQTGGIVRVNNNADTIATKAYARSVGGGGGGTTTNALTVNNSGSGTASPFTFDGSAAKTLSYNSIGAQPTLVSGTSIKTINTNSLLASGDIKLPHNLTTNTTDVGNIGAGVDDLMTYSIPAGQLATDGDYLEFTATVTFAANANNKQVQVIYGGTTVYASGAGAQNDGMMTIKGTIIRTGAATQRIEFSEVTNGTVFTSLPGYVTAAETLSGAVTLKLTGEGTNDNDLVQKILTVKYFPVN